ncbi:MAG: preprotein translocase subunit SecD [Kiritimatiellia bacterium]|jgi:preprotein translocase subunit SecD
MRLGLIIAMFLCSFYVLLPTILQEDPTGLFQQNLDETENQTVAVVDDDKIFLQVESGDPKAMAEALELRFEAAKLEIDSVVVKGKLLEVRLHDVALEQADIEEHFAAAPSISLNNLGVLDGLPEELPTTLDDWAKLDVVKALLGTEPVGGTSSLTIESAVGTTITLASAPLVDPGLLVIVVDGKIEGVALVDGAGPLEPSDTDAPALGTAAHWTPLGQYTSLAEHLAIEPLPGVVSFLQEDQKDVKDDSENGESADDQPHWLPEWVALLLPDTRMPLGLDLQGGIDLTLQVELDEALLSQANRDLTYLQDRAKEKDITIDKVRRDNFEPTLLLHSTTADGAVLTGFFGEVMTGQYGYQDAFTDEDGLVWHRFYMTSELRSEIQKQAVSQVLDVLRRRVAETKVRDPVVVQKGGGRISVQLPGFSDIDAATRTIGKTAVLQFRLVDPEFPRSNIDKLVSAAKSNLSEKKFRNDDTVNRWLHQTGRLPEDRVILFQYETSLDKDTQDLVSKRTWAYALEGEVVLTGQDVNSATVSFDPQTQQPEVSLEFKPAGADIFCTITGERVGKQFAIILDGQVKSAPVIKTRICGGRASISMGNDVDASQEAKSLAVVLRTGSLNAPVSIGQARVIGPSLGEEAIEAGSIATVIGGSVVLIFMAVWYRRAGLLANVGLVLNIMLMLAGLSVFGWTLTLPGIAGIALTIGMAVDANIIIYERIREELRMGQHARKAVETGFKKAAVAVIDANVTTAIAGVVLFSYGNVTIQGFAVTLLMGIGTTLITALFVTRSLLEMTTRRASSRLRI